ncbi:MAG: PspC domain-containing protein [Gammaproteobacteria bacterium]|nr:PspC domain-containing protein [Gammaproteobacteria bacterium]MYG13753.1 PspC domain-containing protein [Gammaproteobacteria bacterium]
MSGKSARGRLRPDRTFKRPRVRGLHLGEDSKIGGVCSGIAEHYGAEPWIVRCIALTGLIFMPSVVFIGYWVLYFVMDDPPDGEAEPAPVPDDRHHSAEAPELGARLSPRRSLRTARAHLAQAELRLRRMEHHVTSGQYDLHREFNRI